MGGWQKECDIHTLHTLHNAYPHSAALHTTNVPQAATLFAKCAPTWCGSNAWSTQAECLCVTLIILGLGPRELFKTVPPAPLPDVARVVCD